MINVARILLLALGLLLVLVTTVTSAPVLCRRVPGDRNVGRARVLSTTTAYPTTRIGLFTFRVVDFRDELLRRRPIHLC